MVDLRLLNIFVVCADVGSFSGAARILYTSQSSVSKAVTALEMNLGGKLFERHARGGLKLTPRGDFVYRQAQRILDDAKKLEGFSPEEGSTILKVSMTPSSYLADRFTKFYLKHLSDDWYYQIYSENCNQVISRLQSLGADIGFVHVRAGDLPVFLYSCSHAKLSFTVLKKLNTVLYSGRGVWEKMGLTEKNVPANISGSPHGSKIIDLVQRVYDGYSIIPPADGFRLRVLTDSDYILDRLLTYTNLSNISSDYMNGKGKYSDRLSRLPSEGEDSVFGYVVRDMEELRTPVKDFLDFIAENSIKEDNRLEEPMKIDGLEKDNKNREN